MTPNDRTEPGVCTRCGGTRVVSIGDGYSVNPCPNCAGQQPAQPGSGEVRVRRFWAEDLPSMDVEVVFAQDFDRLQSALTAAQREKEQKEFGLVHALETLDIERQQLAAEREARQQHANAIWQQGEEIVSLRQQLTAAQREIADLRNRLNLSEKRQDRFPQDAVQPKEPS